MIYIMLVTIIFLLTFCVVGSYTTDYDKVNNIGFKLGLGIVLNVILGIIITVIYFIFLK